MRVIIADHHPQARWALVALLREQPGYAVIGEAAASDSLLKLAVKQPADMILVDYELPGLALADLIDQIHSLDQPPKVIVMSSDSEHARIALNAGADAFVSKGNQPKWLLSALQRFERK
jgi:DNA-binding NarL/FixJ family response regulator